MEEPGDESEEGVGVERTGEYGGHEGYSNGKRDYHHASDYHQQRDYDYGYGGMPDRTFSTDTDYA